MATPIIFPSLSRAPSMDSAEEAADDTIRDSMDSGYVATRPRFTRERRTWTVNVRNLVAEDVRALRNFRANIAKRGAVSFYYPNLLQNGSFEFAPVLAADLVEGWYADPSANLSVSAFQSHATDGSQCILIQTLSETLAAAQYTLGELIYRAPLPCVVGEVYQITASIGLASNALAGIVYGAGVIIEVTYADSSTQTVVSGLTMWNTSFGSPVLYPAGWQATIPAATSGSPAVSMQVSLYTDARNTNGASVTNWLQAAYFDQVGLARVSAPADQIQMAGSSPINALVRFSSGKLPKFSDLGMGGGVKIYGATFSLDEV